MALIDKASLLFVPSVVAEGKAFNVLPSGNRAPDSTDQNSGYDQTRADFDFDRGSNAAASRINSSGLIEKYRENLYTESNNFSDSDWSPKAGTFAQGIEDPNGGNEAWSWTATNTDPYLYQAKNFTGVHCLSIYVKGVGSTIGEDFQIRVGTNTKDITLTGDWQRVQHFGVLSGSVNIGFEYGNPATPNDVVHIYAAQLESGLVATDVLTSGATTAKAGVLVDMPRINYDANGENGSLLLEPSRQNKIQYSEYFGGWGQINTINTANALTSPEGLQNANKLIAASGVNNNVINQQISAGTYTASVFAKKGEFEGLFIGSGPTGAFFNLNTYAYRTHYQSAPTSYKIEDYGNGWHRYSITFTISGNDSLYIGPNDNVSNTLGVTGNNSNGIYIYGAQIEEATYPSSYIPNHGESGGVTRAADSCSVTGASDVIGQTEGTLFFDVNISRVVGNEAIGTINSGAYANHATIQRVGNTIQFVRNSATQSGATIVTSATITAGRYKLAIAYKSGDTACFLNGAQVSTTQTQTFTNATLNAVKIGTDAIGALPISDSVKQATLFKERLTNAELATLTTL